MRQIAGGKQSDPTCKKRNGRRAPILAPVRLLNFEEVTPIKAKVERLRALFKIGENPIPGTEKD